MNTIIFLIHLYVPHGLIKIVFHEFEKYVKPAAVNMATFRRPSLESSKNGLLGPLSQAAITLEVNRTSSSMLGAASLTV